MSEPLTAQFLTSSIVTLTICGFGLFGNLLCSLVLFSARMKRSSYVYLLQALTLSDISLLSLSSLRTLKNLGLLHLPDDVYFSTIVFFWDWISTSATKYFTVAISIERFFVITYPLEAHRLLTCENSKYSTLGIYVFCVVLSSVSYIYLNWIDSDSFHVYVAVVLHFVPFLTVGVFNVLIFLGLRKLKQTSIRQNATKHQCKTEEEETRVTKMLFAVVLIFGFCYLFEFVRRIMNFAWSEYMNTYNYYDYIINVLADIFYVLNSSVNFVIYCVMGRRFRDIVKEKCCLKKRENKKSELVVKGSSSDSGNYSGESVR